MRFSSASFVLAIAVAAVPAIARAQPTQNSTIAESLFRDAQSRLAAGDLGTACDLFARSQRVEAALGTLLNLAACHERDGKTATAWTEFQNGLGWALRTGDKAREQYTRTHVAALEKLLHRVVIEVLEPAEGMQVVLDTGTLPREALGTAIPLDPGEHTIEVTAAGKAPWVRKINLGPAAGTDRIEVRLEPAVQTGAPPPPLPPSAPEVTAVAPGPVSAAAPPALEPMAPSHEEGSHPNGKRIAGFIVGGVGAVGLGAAIILGVSMAENTSQRDSLCPPGNPCGNQKAFDDDHAARIEQQWMFVAGGVAVAGLAVGSVLVLTSHPLTSDPPANGAARGPKLSVVALGEGAGMRLDGSW